jgi:hypothetical protein
MTTPQLLLIAHRCGLFLLFCLLIMLGGVVSLLADHFLQVLIPWSSQ